MPEIKVDTREAKCPVVEASIIVNCRGKSCPVPLVETRKALRQANPGDVVEIIGTHPASKQEIPMAVKALGLELLSIEGTDSDWMICIRR
ncbi:MAG: sulfurtransferase TusA family protein [Chloroflexi bacterium]|nr:MAG: sulfurtransferase TusA family protein [Chloroflexota bacterium]